MSDWYIVDNDGLHLFSVDFVPVVGMVFRYDASHFLCSPDFDEYKTEYIEQVKNMHGKKFIVKQLYCDVRCFRDETTLVNFAVADINPEKSPN